MQEYIRGINKVQDYIERHLSDAITVEELAGAAGFSKYHFSRIFLGIMHESLGHYVTRIRMERAKFLLAHRRDKNMTQIAYEVGSTDSAAFSRTFKKYCGISPSQYRKQYSKNCKEFLALSEYNKAVEKRKPRQLQQELIKNVTLETILSNQAVYIRHTGTYQELAEEFRVMIEALYRHAKEENLLEEGKNQVLAMYHDNPEFADETQFRTSLCLTVPEGRKAKEDEVFGLLTIEGGLYVVGHFSILPEQYPDAWDYMYREWIVGKGYVPRDMAPFEVYRNPPDEEQRNEVDIYLPVEALR